jgi:predicted DNA-binding transcriptional regulator AlpA
MRRETMLTTEEVAALIRTSVSGVSGMRYRGVGPRGVRVGRRVLYPESAVLEWLESRADKVDDSTPA